MEPIANAITIKVGEYTTELICVDEHDRDMLALAERQQSGNKFDPIFFAEYGDFMFYIDNEVMPYLIIR